MKHKIVVLLLSVSFVGMEKSLAAPSACSDPRYSQLLPNGPGGQNWCCKNSSSEDLSGTTNCRIASAQLQLNDAGKNPLNEWEPCTPAQRGLHHRIDFAQKSVPASSNSCRIAKPEYTSTVHAEAINFVCVNKRRTDAAEIPDPYWKPVCGSNLTILGSPPLACLYETMNTVYTLLNQLYPPPAQCPNSGWAGSGSNQGYYADSRYFNPYTGRIGSPDLPPFMAGSDYTKYSGGGSRVGGDFGTTPGGGKGCPSTMTLARILGLLGWQGGPDLEQNPVTVTRNGVTCTYDCSQARNPTNACTRVETLP